MFNYQKNTTMKNLSMSITMLLFSLAMFVYTTNASNLSASSCNKSCGSVSDCESGSSFELDQGWSDCYIYPDGSCAVYGAYC